MSEKSSREEETSAETYAPKRLRREEPDAELSPEELASMTPEDRLALAVKLVNETPLDDYEVTAEPHRSGKGRRVASRRERMLNRKKKKPTKKIKPSKPKGKESTKERLVMDNYLPLASEEFDETAGVNEKSELLAEAGDEIESYGPIRTIAPASEGENYSNFFEEELDSSQELIAPATEDLASIMELPPDPDGVDGEEGEEERIDVSPHIDLLRSQNNSRAATRAILAEVRDVQLTEAIFNPEGAPFIEANEIASRSRRRDDLSREDLARLREEEERELKENPALAAEDSQIVRYVIIAAAIAIILTLFTLWNIFSA